jgi:hypothetical protein
MRLIDADALYDAFEDAHWYDNNDRDYVAEDVLMDAPTIDAAPTAHGEWIEAKANGMSLYPDGQKMCSVCNQIMPHAWVKMPPYCFGCGAKIEEATD